MVGPLHGVANRPGAPSSAVVLPSGASACGDSTSRHAQNIRDYIASRIGSSSEYYDSLRVSWGLVRADSAGLAFVADSTTCAQARALYWDATDADGAPPDSIRMYVLSARHWRFINMARTDTGFVFGHSSTIVADSSLTVTIGAL